MACIRLSLAAGAVALFAAHAHAQSRWMYEGQPGGLPPMAYTGGGSPPPYSPPAYQPPQTYNYGGYPISQDMSLPPLNRADDQ